MNAKERAVNSALYKVRALIESTLADSFQNRCISNKEMALNCLDACCPEQYRTDEYKRAIKLIESIGVKQD
jgi:hypothetical protein